MAASVDLSRFSSAISALSRMSGRDLASVMKAETGKILETAVRYTPKADAAKIKEQVTQDTKWRFEHGGESDSGTFYTTKAGKVWFSPGEGKAVWFLIHDWRVPDAVWRDFQRVLSADLSDYQATLARRLEEALARRGLTAATWLQVAKAIGAAAKAPGYIEKARIPANVGTGTVTVTGQNVTIEGGNKSLVLTATNTGTGIINRAINSRIKFFETSLAKGAFQTLQSKARAYPALFR